MVIMHIKAKMVKIHDQKQMKTKIEAPSKIQKDCAAFIKLLREQEFQASLEIVASHVEVNHILEVSIERTHDHILAKSLEKVLE